MIVWLLGLFISSIVLSIGCSGSNSTSPGISKENFGATPAPGSTPTLTATSTSPLSPELPPAYTPVPLSQVYTDTAYLAVVEGVSSVIEGVVEVAQSKATVEPQGEQLGVTYSDWSVRVVRYLVDPLPHKSITVRLVEYFLAADGTTIGHRTPYKLSQGEEVILFLTKRGEVGPTLSDNEFTIYVAAGPGIQSKVLVEDGKVRVMREGRSVIEAVEDFTARIQRYAQQAGRIAF